MQCAHLHSRALSSRPVGAPYSVKSTRASSEPVRAELCITDQSHKCSLHKVYFITFKVHKFYIIDNVIILFYVPQPRKLVFPLQLRVKQCCIFRYRGIQCRNWTAHVHYSFTAERNLFLLLLTSSSYSVSTDYYTRPIKSKWPGLVANLRPLRTTSAAKNYNKY